MWELLAAGLAHRVRTGSLARQGDKCTDSVDSPSHTRHVGATRRAVGCSLQEGFEGVREVDVGSYWQLAWPIAYAARPGRVASAHTAPTYPVKHDMWG